MAGFAESTFSVFNINDFEPGVAPTADVIQGNKSHAEVIQMIL